MDTPAATNDQQLNNSFSSTTNININTNGAAQSNKAFAAFDDNFVDDSAATSNSTAANAVTAAAAAAAATTTTNTNEGNLVNFDDPDFKFNFDEFQYQDKQHRMSESSL